MNRFFTDAQPLAGSLVPLSPEDARHALLVMRVKPGEQAELLYRGQRFLAEAAELTGEQALFRVLSPLPSTEPRLRVTLFQGLPKADKMELVVQKSVELGVEAVVPVAFDRCVVRLDARDATRKTERWQKIARETCKQSGRCLEPAVGLPLSVSALCERLKDFDAVLVPWEEAHGLSLPAFCRDHPSLTRLALIIGPEGGITPEEVERLKAAGGIALTLGPRILRTETAGPACLAALMALYGEMEV